MGNCWHHDGATTTERTEHHGYRNWKVPGKKICKKEKRAKNVLDKLEHRLSKSLDWSRKTLQCLFTGHFHQFYDDMWSKRLIKYNVVLPAVAVVDETAPLSRAEHPIMDYSEHLVGKIDVTLTLFAVANNSEGNQAVFILDKGDMFIKACICFLIQQRCVANGHRWRKAESAEQFKKVLTAVYITMYFADLPHAGSMINHGVMDLLVWTSSMNWEAEIPSEYQERISKSCFNVGVNILLKGKQKSEGMKVLWNHMSSSMMYYVEMYTEAKSRRVPPDHGIGCTKSESEVKDKALEAGMWWMCSCHSCLLLSMYKVGSWNSCHYRSLIPAPCSYVGDTT